MIVSLIAAVGKNLQLGAGNKMLWHNREDFKLFKSFTTGHHLLMGRKTFDSIGKPLPDRTTLILTQDESLLGLYSPQKKSNVYAFKTAMDAISFARSCGEKELFVAGGGEIYKLLLPMAKRLYISFMNYDGPAEVYFPSFEVNDFKILQEAPYSNQDKTQEFTFKLFERL